jgi:hypothetical protein
MAAFCSAFSVDLAEFFRARVWCSSSERSEDDEISSSESSPGIFVGIFGNVGSSCTMDGADCTMDGADCTMDGADCTMDG